jgi:hypothetical protein
MLSLCLKISITEIEQALKKYSTQAKEMTATLATNTNNFGSATQRAEENTLDAPAIEIKGLDYGENWPNDTDIKVSSFRQNSSKNSQHI